MITQTDLHYRPEMLDRIPSVAIVGHDEYWTHDMRTRIEGYVEDGGQLARFGGNFMWQVRLEENGARQVCYKFIAANDDPVSDTEAHLLTGAWESREVNWPGATTVGVNGLHGVYASWGGFSPRGSKGFTVYRPDHWVFEGTRLGYADIFGDEANIFSYEVDGLDYTFRHGLPYPIQADGAPESVTILAMAPAGKAEAMFPVEGYRYYLGESDMRGAAQSLYGNQDPETLDKVRYGSGMLVHMPTRTRRGRHCRHLRMGDGPHAQRVLYLPHHPYGARPLHRRSVGSDLKPDPGGLMIESTKFRKWIGAAAVAMACSTMASTAALAEPQKGGVLRYANAVGSRHARSVRLEQRRRARDHPSPVRLAGGGGRASTRPGR